MPDTTPVKSSAAAKPDTRPVLAIVSGVLTPYRVWLHQRIVREVPEIQLNTLLTHDAPDQPWSLDGGEIGVVKFGEGERVDQVRPMKQAPANWAKGGRIIDWVRANNVRALMVCGYNDMTRLRVIRWARAAGMPVFLVADSNSKGDLAKGWRRALKNVVIRWVVKRCDGMAPFGSRGAEYFVQRGASPDRVYYFPCEPDYDLIRALPEAKIRETKEKLGLKDGRRRMVVCSRMVPAKRVDLAIDVFAAVADKRPEWDLVIIGDGPLKKELEARTPAHLKDRVLWTGFIGDQSVVSAVYRNADVLLHTADFEPWGLIINEAAAAGLAIVTTDVVGAVPELVRDGVNGRVAPAGDAAALTAALLDATEPGRLAAFKAAAPVVLDDWRRRGDPIAGLRRALESVKVLPANGSTGVGRR